MILPLTFHANIKAGLPGPANHTYATVIVGTSDRHMVFSWNKRLSTARRAKFAAEEWMHAERVVIVKADSLTAMFDPDTAECLS